MVVSLLLHILGSSTCSFIKSDDLSLSSSIGGFLSSNRTIFERREEFLNQSCTGEVTAPTIGSTHIRHSSDTGRTYQIIGATITFCFCTILTDRQDDFFHSLRILVIISHKHLLITSIAILFSFRKFIFPIKQIAIVNSLLIVFYRTFGINSRVQSQTGMEHISGTFIGTSKVRRVIECTHFGKIRFYFGQLLVNPVIKFFTSFLYRQFINIVRSLERSLSPKIEEVPHMEGTQKADLGTILFIVSLFSLILGVGKIEVTERHIESQTLERPLHANR